MGPIWGRQVPGGPHFGPMNLDIWVRINALNAAWLWLIFSRKRGPDICSLLFLIIMVMINNYDDDDDGDNSNNDSLVFIAQESIKDPIPCIHAPFKGLKKLSILAPESVVLTGE